MTAFDANSELRTYYIPEEETRRLRFDGGFWTDDNGTLITPVTLLEDGEERAVLLKQYYADRLIRDLIQTAPDPNDKLRVTRHGSGEYQVELETTVASEGM